MTFPNRIILNIWSSDKSLISTNLTIRTVPELGVASLLHYISLQLDNSHSFFTLIYKHLPLDPLQTLHDVATENGPGSISIQLEKSTHNQRAVSVPTTHTNEVAVHCVSEFLNLDKTAFFKWDTTISRLKKDICVTHNLEWDKLEISYQNEKLRQGEEDVTLSELFGYDIVADGVVFDLGVTCVNMGFDATQGEFQVRLLSDVDLLNNNTMKCTMQTRISDIKDFIIEEYRQSLRLNRGEIKLLYGGQFLEGTSSLSSILKNKYPQMGALNLHYVIKESTQDNRPGFWREMLNGREAFQFMPRENEPHDDSLEADIIVEEPTGQASNIPGFTGNVFEEYIDDQGQTVYLANAFSLEINGHTIHVSGNELKLYDHYIDVSPELAAQLRTHGIELPTPTPTRANVEANDRNFQIRQLVLLVLFTVYLVLKNSILGLFILFQFSMFLNWPAIIIGFSSILIYALCSTQEIRNMWGEFFLHNAEGAEEAQPEAHEIGPEQNSQQENHNLEDTLQTAEERVDQDVFEGERNDVENIAEEAFQGAGDNLTPEDVQQLREIVANRLEFSNQPRTQNFRGRRLNRQRLGIGLVLRLVEVYENITNLPVVQIAIYLWNGGLIAWIVNRDRNSIFVKLIKDIVLFFVLLVPHFHDQFEAAVM